MSCCTLWVGRWKGRRREGEKTSVGGRKGGLTRRDPGGSALKGFWVLILNAGCRSGSWA